MTHVQNCLKYQQKCNFLTNVYSRISRAGYTFYAIKNNYFNHNFYAQELIEKMGLEIILYNRFFHEIKKRLFGKVVTNELEFFHEKNRR